MQDTITSTSLPQRKQLKLLSLDGGGVRGLSSLVNLKKLMEMIDPNEPPKPCDYFDMIWGTRCIDEYRELSTPVFTKKQFRVNFRGKLQGRFDHVALELGIKDLVKKKLRDSDALSKDNSYQGDIKRSSVPQLCRRRYISQESRTQR